MKDQRFKELLKGLKSGKSLPKGDRKSTSRSYRFQPRKITGLRKSLGLTQSEFAHLLCVSAGTLRNWEQGRTYPDGPALALLRMAETKPKAILEALHPG